MILRSCARWVARYWVTTLIVGIVAGVLGGIVYAALNKPEYTSSATISLKAVESGNTTPGAQSIVQQLSASALALFTSPRTLEPAGKSLTPPISTSQLQQNLTVRAPSDSLVFTASINATDSDRATAVMTAVTSEFKKAIEAGGLPSFGNVSLGVGDITIKTELAAHTVKGRLPSLVVGFAVGLLVGTFYLFVRVLINDRIWTPEDIHALTDDAVLSASENGSLADTARVVKEGLPFFVPAGEPRTVAISSVDGSSISLARELANQISAAGDRVALVDTDLANRPLGDGGAGFADAAAGLVPASEAVSPVGGVNVVLAGGPAPNPIDLLSRGQASEFIASLSEKHQWVIISTATMVDSSAGAAGARLASATLLVVDQGSTTRQNLRDALDLVKMTNVQVAGIVLS